MVMQQNVDISGSWLTVNRVCNFRCKWCYAEGTKYSKEDNMSLELAKKLIDFQAELGVKNVIILGGEPTLWKDLFTVIDLIAQKGMRSTIVTNGLLLSDEKYLEKLKASPVGEINISLKSGNKEQHMELTGSKRFDGVMKAIRNVTKSGINVGFSVTLNSFILNNIVEIAKVAAENGANGLGIHFCTTTFNDDMPQQGFMSDPRDVIAKIVETYGEMSNIMNGNVSLLQSLPVCLWPESFLEDLDRNGKITYGCHVKSRNGLIFDPNGKVIPCNCLYDYPIATFGEDFWDVNSFKKFWSKKEIVEIYDKFISYPSELCIGCSKFVKCGGGCPLHWFVNKPEGLISA